MSDDDFEMDFWNGAINTLGEELKQLTYLEKMGFQRTPTWRTQYAFDAEGKSIIDIGGGPCSVLLKMEHLKRGVVVDPGMYPNWVESRYSRADIGYMIERGEDLIYENGDIRSYTAAHATPTVCAGGFDVALVYNVLQHTIDPAKVIANARTVAKELRVFEWIEIAPHVGHPHCLSAAELDEWCGRKGTVETFHGVNECFGKAWYLGPDGAVGAVGAK
jgi:hypothetical protein